MYEVATARTLEGIGTPDGRDVVTMIDWESDSWGGTVHLAANGSWVRDKRGHDAEHED